MEKLLNKCPVCGSKLIYNALMQYVDVYALLNNGKLSKKRIRKENVGSMECGFFSCTNENCEFVTDCDLQPEKIKYHIRIYQIEDMYYYKNKD